MNVVLLATAFEHKSRSELADVIAPSHVSFALAMMILIPQHLARRYSSLRRHLVKLFGG